MTEQPGRWWYLDLAADFPELEIYYGGWRAEQETGLLELGERVMDHEVDWLCTRIYSKERDRIWAAVSSMSRMVYQAMRDRGLYPDVDPIPPGWKPDVETWDAGRLPLCSARSSEKNGPESTGVRSASPPGGTRSGSR